jgi:hypothetical protein
MNLLYSYPFYDFNCVLGRGGGRHLRTFKAVVFVLWLAAAYRRVQAPGSNLGPAPEVGITGRRESLRTVVQVQS